MMFPQIQQYLGRTISISTQFLVVLLLLRFFVIDPGLVNGQSMEPNYYDGDYFLVNRIVYLVRAPARFDVVQLFDRAADQFFVKRIVGLPGETVMIKHDGVYVQLTTGETIKLDESYLSSESRTSVQPGQRTTIHVPADAYYVLGDNRLHSNDSRDFGAVHRRYIQGKIFSF